MALPRLTAASALVLVMGAATPVAGQMMDKKVYTFVRADQLEYSPNGDERPVILSGEAWIGGDYSRFWTKVDGEVATAESAGEVQVQGLYSRMIGPYWDFQAGLRLDTRFGDGGDQARGLLAVGIEGLAPYWFELESTLFVSQDGDVSARLEASYELLFTQRFIVEPDFELGVAVQDVPEWGVGSGFTDLELGLRARYEIVRELAPYLGLSWQRLLGGTGDLAVDTGRPAGETRLVIGVRAWY